MSEGKRPGGLTALAVLNFVGAGINLLGVAGMVVMVVAQRAMDPDNNDFAGLHKAIAMWEQEGWGIFYALLVLTGLRALLLIASGIGFLQQRRFLGHKVGNVYALVGIGSALFQSLVVKNPELGGGFNIGTIINLVYPLLALVLINTTFKEDFVR